MAFAGIENPKIRDEKRERLKLLLASKTKEENEFLLALKMAYGDEWKDFDLGELPKEFKTTYEGFERLKKLRIAEIVLPTI